MTQLVPEPREIPETVPYREVEHDEREDNPDDWAFRSYPVGSVRDEDFWGWPTKADETAWWKERKRKDAARDQLGGFGFGTHVARAGQGDG
jgi:hypothetical protein